MAEVKMLHFKRQRRRRRRAIDEQAARCNQPRNNQFLPYLQVSGILYAVSLLQSGYGDAESRGDASKGVSGPHPVNDWSGRRGQRWCRRRPVWRGRCRFSYIWTGERGDGSRGRTLRRHGEQSARMRKAAGAQSSERVQPALLPSMLTTPSGLLSDVRTNQLTIVEGCGFAVNGLTRCYITLPCQHHSGRISGQSHLIVRGPGGSQFSIRRVCNANFGAFLIA